MNRFSTLDWKTMGPPLGQRFVLNTENIPPRWERKRKPQQEPPQQTRGVKRKLAEIEEPEAFRNTCAYKEVFLTLTKHADLSAAKLKQLVFPGEEEQPKPVVGPVSIKQENFSTLSDCNAIDNDLILSKTLRLLPAADIKNCRLVSNRWYALATEILPSVAGPISFSSVAKVKRYLKLAKTNAAEKLPYTKFLMSKAHPQILQHINVLVPQIEELEIRPGWLAGPHSLHFGNVLSFVDLLVNLRSLILSNLHFPPLNLYGNDLTPPTQIQSIRKLCIKGCYDFLSAATIAVINANPGPIHRIFSVAPNLKEVELKIIGHAVLPTFLTALRQLPRLEVLVLNICIPEPLVAHLLSLPKPFALKSLSLTIHFSQHGILVEFLRAHAQSLESLNLQICLDPVTQFRPIEFPVFTRLGQLKLYTEASFFDPNMTFPLIRRIKGDEFPALETLDITLDVLHCYAPPHLPFPKVRDLKLMQSFFRCYNDIHGPTLKTSFPQLSTVRIPFPKMDHVKSIVQEGASYLEELHLGYIIGLNTRCINEAYTGIPKPNWMVKELDFGKFCTIDSYVALSMMRKVSQKNGINFKDMKCLKRLELWGGCRPKDPLMDVVVWLTILPAPTLQRLTLVNAEISASSIDELKKKHSVVLFRNEDRLSTIDLLPHVHH